METLTYSNIFIGVIFILLGFLVFKYPILIAGYNTMSREEKDAFNIEQFKAGMKRAMIGAGIFIIVGDFICQLVSFAFGQSIIVLLACICLTIYLYTLSKKCMKRKLPQTRFRRMAKYIWAAIIILVVVGMIYSTREPVVTINKEKINISGIYGFDIALNEIDSVVLVNSIPSIRMRTNGLAFGLVLKGNFRLADQSKCKLFLRANEGPYLKIVYSNGKMVFINYKDKNKTSELYNWARGAVEESKY